jgi:uncharacterized protein YggE
MTSQWSRLAAGCWILVACVGIAGESAAENKSVVSVTGEGVVDAPPDLFILTVGINTRDTDIDKARKNLAERASKVVEAARKFPLDRARTFTSSLNVSLAYGADGRFIGHDIGQTIRFAIGDVRQAEDFTVAVVKAGATHIHSMEFTVKNAAELWDRARALAVENALHRANGMAKPLMRRAGAPTNISSQDNSNQTMLGCRWDNVPLQEASADLRAEDRLHLIPPANTKIIARVNVTFALELLLGC